MSEIKQTNFRIDQETADKFRKFCEEQGLNQAQGFDHIMQVVELDRAKAAVPSSSKDIESFEMYIKKIMESYLKAVEDYNSAEERIREQFTSALESKDKTIRDLQDRVAGLENDKAATEQIANSAALSAAQAAKEADSARTQAETSASLVLEKDKTISTLADKLSAAEAKADGYDALKKSEEDAKTQIKDLQWELDAQKKDAESKLAALSSENQRNLENAQKEADRVLADVKKDHKTEIDRLQAEKDRAVSDAQKDGKLAAAEAVAAAKEQMEQKLRDADRENVKLQLRIEALESRLKELEIRNAENGINRRTAECSE